MHCAQKKTAGRIDLTKYKPASLEVLVTLAENALEGSSAVQATAASSRIQGFLGRCEMYANNRQLLHQEQGCAKLFERKCYFCN